MTRRSIRIGEADFSVAEEYAALREGIARAGAVVCFTGLVRDFSDGADVASIHLQHYPGMTEKRLDEILRQAEARWPLLAARVVHRVGELRPAEQIVFVGVASEHRGDAFAACEFIMDYLKTRATIWKKQMGGDRAVWLDARESDLQAADRWQN